MEKLEPQVVKDRKLHDGYHYFTRSILLGILPKSMLILSCCLYWLIPSKFLRLATAAAPLFFHGEDNKDAAQFVVFGQPGRRRVFLFGDGSMWFNASSHVVIGGGP